MHDTPKAFEFQWQQEVGSSEYDSSRVGIVWKMDGGFEKSNKCEERSENALILYVAMTPNADNPES